MGRNGSGKSSLLWALQGQGPRSAGAVHLTGADADPGHARAGRRAAARRPGSPVALGPALPVRGAGGVRRRGRAGRRTGWHGP
ncbi:ABC transporter ATP-binding protein [Georgenia sp. SUBG003]|uniref:ATP-binding cassette domain-containing protein n=1 Tax=Georgenia sp. SUBG003 TaxID=1497974 RepID=UPI003AB165ED